MSKKEAMQTNLGGVNFPRGQFQVNKSQDSMAGGGYDSSNNYGQHQDPSMFHGETMNNQSMVERFMKDHQDATLEKGAWVPDNKVNKCTKCRKDFTFFYRKHHCRICGNVFCANCTLVRPVVNKDIQQNVRMCENCLHDLDNYNKSLKIKTNLLNADQRQSYMQSNENSIHDNPILFGGNTNVGGANAPRNNERPSSIDSREDDYETQRKFHENVELMEEEDLKQLEEYKKRATILENADKTDMNDYLKGGEDEDKTERTFSDMRSVHSAAIKEISVKQRLKEYSIYHIQQIVIDIMRQFSIDQAKWGSRLLEFVQTAVDNVRPSSRSLNDSMNFNSFIKIKIINWKDNSKSAYINGVVMSKNIADKRMNSLINDPQILLLKESVGTMKNDGTSLTEIQSLVDQEEHWIEIIKQKLTQVKPNIIIVEKDVGYKILDVLREAGITVITNLTHHKMKRVQRYTQTIISPSYNVIDKSFVLGKCKQFRVEAPFSGTQMHRMQFDFESKKHKDGAGNFVTNDRSLIYFEGTLPDLGCTILISGNRATENEELKKVKQALREMLKLARNVVLERAFLLQLGCAVPKPSFDDKGQLVASESPFLITRNIQNRQTLVMSKVQMKKGVVQTQQTTTVATPNITGNTQGVNISQNINPQAFAKIGEEDVSMQQNFESAQVLQKQKEADQQKVNENFVKTKIDSMCGCPKKEKMTFYQKETDETIGKFLYRISKMHMSQCVDCKEQMFKHFIQYYHKDGCLEIQLEMKQLQQPVRAGPFNRNIIMRAECKLCCKQVTDDMVMSNTFFEYSKARFLEQFFYNGDKLLNAGKQCRHKSLKDMHRIFIMPGGFQITFTFIPLEVYQIEMIQPKKQDTSALFKTEIEKRKFKMLEFVNQAYPELKGKMQVLIEFIKNEKRNCLSKEAQKRLEHTNITLFTQPLKRIKERLSPQDPQQIVDDKQSNTFENDLTHMVSEIQKPIQEVKTIFEAMFLERKILLNFLTYSKILEETAKIVCLLLVLLRLRMIVITKQEQSMNGTFTFDDQITKGETDKIDMQVLAAGEKLPQYPPFNRRNSNLKDVFNETMQSQSHPTISKEPSVNSSNLGGYQQQQQPQPGFNFIEDFITGQDLRSLVNISMNQGLQGVGARGDLPVQPMQSSKMVTQTTNNAQNLESVKSFVYQQYLNLYDKLQLITRQQGELHYNNYQNSERTGIEDEEEKTNGYNGGDISLIRGREGSQNQNAQQNKTQMVSSIQNITQLNLISNNNDFLTYNQNPQSIQWAQYLNCGYVTMPLGTDNTYIPLNDSNIGSIISFALSSNIYKEAMIKQNYMDIGSKIKAPMKHTRGQAFTNSGASADPSVAGGPNSSLRESFLGGPPPQNAVPNQNPFGGHGITTLTIDEAVKLFGKDDVFNYDLSPHQIETELLCGERLYFQIKFSTDKRDLSLRMVKNGQITKLKSTSMQFVTGKVHRVPVQSKNATGSNADQSKIKKKEEIIKNDLQDRICNSVSKDYMDTGNHFFMEQMGLLDTVVRLLNQGYFQAAPLGGPIGGGGVSSVTTSPFIKAASPTRGGGALGTDDHMNLEFQMVPDMQGYGGTQNSANPNFIATPVLDLSVSHGNLPMPNLGNTNVMGGQNTSTLPNLRESIIQNMKSPPIGVSGNTPLIGGPPQMSPQIGAGGQQTHYDPQEFCKVQTPIVSLLDPFDTLSKELRIPKVDYELKVFFPKKFEALRRFYCGSQYDFIESLIQTQEWTTVTGGKTKSKFYRSFDDKYVFKEIKKSEFKMFLEFAPQYFDYLCKSFFHNYPCALCKILGAYKIKITTNKGNNQAKIIKKYIYITENLNFGIKPEDEPHIIRYDLKGSTLNRFVKKQMNNEMNRVVLHDNNFQYTFKGRPLPIRYTINRILHICINNDTLCLSKSNIVDYSLLAIIDTKRRKVRFGIIDFVQQYTIDKIFEGQFKRIINRGEVPTIVDPDKYKQRFKRAMKRYFIGMVVQEEKTAQDALNKQELMELQLQQQMIAEDNDSDEDDNELNETSGAIKRALNDTQQNIAPNAMTSGGGNVSHKTPESDHGATSHQEAAGTVSGSENQSQIQISPAMQ